MAQSGSPPSSELFRQLEQLYPLACILVGADQADTLLLRVVERVGECPPRERPDDLQSWSLRLLLQETEGSDHANTGGTSNRGPDDEQDDLREDVARQQLDDALPIALASCSREERFLLALDVLHESNEAKTPDLSAALNLPSEEARSVQSDAWGKLRTHLRNALSSAAQSLVDEVLSEEAIEEAVRDVLLTRISGMPSSLRVRVRSALETRHRREVSASKGSSEESGPSGTGVKSWWSASRVVLLSLFVLALVIATGIGIWYVPSSPSPAPTHSSLTTFSRTQLDSVEPVIQTDRPEQAESYVQSTWNREVRLPSVAGANLRGIGRLRVETDEEVPVFLFGDSSDTGRVAIFAYSYALVDQLEDKAILGESDRTALAQNKQPVTQQNSKENGIIWRDRDEIFVAVAPSLDLETLRERIQP